MSRWLLLPLALVLLPPAWGQSAADSPAPASAQNPAQPANPAADSPTADNAKAPKKIWTNDNIHDVAGPVSVVGQKNSTRGRTGENRAADPATVAGLKQSLEKLQSQLSDTNKELESFKRFLSGEAVTTGGVETNHGISRIPVPQQIASLEAKKKKLEEQIDSLLDEARKKGVEPGELR